MIAYYEIFRRHTSTDRRDCGASWDYTIGYCDIEDDIGDIVNSYQQKANVVIEKFKAMTPIHEDGEYNGFPSRRFIGWNDPLDFDQALKEFRAAYDPGFKPSDKPTYHYRKIIIEHKLKRLD